MPCLWLRKSRGTRDEFRHKVFSLILDRNKAQSVCDWDKVTGLGRGRDRGKIPGLPFPHTLCYTMTGLEEPSMSERASVTG